MLTGAARAIAEVSLTVMEEKIEANRASGLLQFFWEGQIRNAHIDGIEPDFNESSQNHALELVILFGRTEMIAFGGVGEIQS